MILNTTAKLMASTTCTRCLRVLRMQAHPQSHTQIISKRNCPTSVTGARALSSSLRRPQEARQVPDASPNTLPPPTTAGAVTTNVTAANPSSPSRSQHASSVASHTSTAEMQKQIASSLATGGRPSIGHTLAQKLRQTSKSATESYITYGLTEAFFKSCAAQAPYTIPEEQRTKILTDKGPPKTVDGEDLGNAEAQTWWFTDLGLPPTFSTWSQVSYLHLYLLSVKLRTMESSSAYTNYQRYLIEHFSNAAEDKMLLLHSINARGIRNKYLKDLFLQWRGILAAYDEGLAKGDAVLASAVWRNLWKGKEDVDWEKVAEVVVYMRRVLIKLDEIPLDELVHNLDTGARVWAFGRQNVRNITDIKSQGIQQAAAQPT